MYVSYLVKSEKFNVGMAAVFSREPPTLTDSGSFIVKPLYSIITSSEDDVIDTGLEVATKYGLSKVYVVWGSSYYIISFWRNPIEFAMSVEEALSKLGIVLNVEVLEKDDKQRNDVKHITVTAKVLTEYIDSDTLAEVVGWLVNLGELDFSMNVDKKTGSIVVTFSIRVAFEKVE